MNICFLTGDMSRAGGTARMCSWLANEICITNNVSIIALNSAYAENSFFKLEEKIEYTIMKSGKSKLDMLFCINRIRQYLIKKNINILINVDIGCAVYGIPASFFTQTKVITWEHSNYFNNWNSKVFPYFRKYAAKFSDALVVLTDTDKENYRKYIQTKKRIISIHNPIDEHYFKYDVDSKCIISAGILTDIKRFDLAIDVAAKVLVKNPDWKWYIYGEGLRRDALESKVREYHLENQIILPGAVSDLGEKYKESSFYVMTSKMEGLPMVLLEAKSYGLPIVSFDIMTGPRDIIIDNVNGYLIPDNDTEEMISRINLLINSRELRVQMSANSQVDMEKFHPNYIISQWNLLFNSL